MFSEQITKAAGYLLTGVVLYSTSIVFYNLYINPLSKYPGSWLYTSTPFPRLWLYISGREPFVVLDMHKRYGPIVRIAPNELSFIDQQAWKDIYGHKNNNPKDPTFYPFAPDTKNSLILANDEDHHRMRKMFLPAFSARALRDQNDMLNHYVRKLVEGLKEKQKNGEKVDLVKFYNFTTFDVIADLCFGESLGLLEKQEYTPWLQGIFDQIFLACSSRTIQYFPLLWMVVQKFMPKSLTDAANASFKHSSDRVDKRLAMDTDRPDIFGLVLKHKDGANMSRQMMYSNADLLMIAGTETTATMLSGLTYNLLRNPGPMKRLTAEIRERFASEDDITIDELPRLPYLTACIEEGLRTYPSVAEGVRRKTKPGTATEICGQWIPPNVGVSVPHYAAYHSEYNFVEPNSFIPERWLAEGIDGHDPCFAADKKSAMNPFSTGPRNCIGMNLAYHEMRLIVAHLLWNFDLEADDVPQDWLKQEVHVVWDKKPLMVGFCHRSKVTFETTT
ncbi:cytochrome P450 [Aureobasidium pullulans]|uniref:Cytochrome P450 n=1 Tax=Aureobasidium pullulans TaxID=5580 RepID=A0A4S8Y0V5_AURPU|nr:cytochrome P450 [Aureobasidium pullulans]TIA47484.1 cytochrome P450 [Aureobasidium pullulans]